ncbi:glycoside hydrolase family 172 protein [Allomuricauda sp. d1]|uniref:glycoside hydrolase family 172 protein n=1 Tax=Allomuricauda sp. d1 TaxID=3136725 RepID=UPI0031D51A1C
MIRRTVERKSIQIIGFVALLILSTCQKEEKTVSYADLVNRLTDLKSLAELPVAGEKSAMWSSYDRDSKIDSTSDKFIDWDANNDGFKPQYIRKEGDNEVLAEMTGPGAIVRIWSASPRKGKVNIYIDGSEEPVVSESFIDYFSPSIPAFDYPELVYETNAKGFNNYVPIPYQKSCKIVAEPGWGQYYHFNYITFPESTQLEVFNPNPTQEGKQTLDQVNSFFAERMGDYPHEREDLKKEAAEIELAANERKTAFSLKGKGAIATFKAKFNNFDPANIEEIMRKTILEIRWDGEENPSVWTPLGDFFGTSPGWNEYKTLPMGMTDEWAYSYWYMPFADGAEISLQNHYDGPVSVTLELQKEELSGNMDCYGRFHAKWHRDLAPLEEERWPDWRLLETKGKGRFLGAHLLVWNPKGGSSESGGPGHFWWGEGDEKFFIDGEQFPSTFGTGTEDYFGYAWCNPSVFEQAFHSQTQDNDNMGYQPMNRWQITDNVPFQKSFDGYLEKYFPNELPTQYSTVVYWYLDSEGEDTLAAVAPDELYGYETPFEVFRQEGALEAENLTVAENTGGWVSTDFWAHESLFETVSGHKIMVWFAAKDKPNNLEATFEWPKAGNYEVYANLVKREDGGKFDVKINGKKLSTLDFYAPKDDKQTERVRLGRVRLQPGEQQVELGWSGNGDFPQAMRMDYLEFKKV